MSEPKNETPEGRGEVYYQGEPICRVDYEIRVTVPRSIRRAMGAEPKAERGIPEVEGRVSADSVTLSNLYEISATQDNPLILQLQDGRRQDFALEDTGTGAIIAFGAPYRPEDG
jgi:hypothetical protein